LERGDLVAAWHSSHPDGEVVVLHPAPPAGRLVRELASRSLFATARMIVVPDAAPLFSPDDDEPADGVDLAPELTSLRLDDTCLLLCVVSEAEPSAKEPLVTVVRERGTVRYLEVPASPKPWDEVRITVPQRAVLAGLIARTQPGLVDFPEVVDALCETYGFRPRLLVEAAERVALAGEMTAEAVRRQAGPGELSTSELENALVGHDSKGLVRFFTTLGTNGTLFDWKGKAVAPEGYGAVLVPAAGRLLRRALAVRAHARRAGIVAELDPRRVNEKFWYPKRFKPSILPTLERDIKAVSGSPLAGSSPWQLHLAFRFAAHHQEAELRRAVTRLGGLGGERAGSREAVSVLATVLLPLVGPTEKKAPRRAPGA
jgi:hypothetical protein